MISTATSHAAQRTMNGDVSTAMRMPPGSGAIVRIGAPPPHAARQRRDARAQVLDGGIDAGHGGMIGDGG